MSEDKVMPEKANLTSIDIGESNRAQVKQMFPSVFTETINDKGELVESIDFEKLKAELGTFSDVFEARRERYGMDWPGKKECMKLIQKPSIATLKPCREESVNFDETENLFIEGDNLEVLKLLQKSYYGKIRLIYIDPPYNTGKEFIYPDDYAESIDTYLAYAGLADDTGKRFSTNNPSEGRFHTKWLNMMYPRLYLARNLLRDDGLLFISIDDNEVTNLRSLCDEILGPDSFVAQIVWQKRTAPDMRTTFSDAHEYILLYGKTPQAGLSLKKLALTDEEKQRYKNPDNDPKGPWVSSDYTARGIRPNQLYGITTPSGRVFFPPPGKCWQNVEEVFLEQLAEGRFHFGANGDSVPRRKNYLKETDGKIPWTWWSNKEVGHSQEGKLEVNGIFGRAEVFSTPKPVRLLERIIEIASTDDSIVLDFFAGSATTAHATLKYDMEHGRAVKYILVQLPEILDPENIDHKQAFDFCKETNIPPTVADIGKERIRRVIAKIQSRVSGIRESGQADLLQPQVEVLDLGFKVFRLDKSNFNVWNGSESKPTEERIAEQLEAFVEHIDPKATQEDILFELLLKAGFKPTEKIEAIDFAGKSVFSVAEGLLLICLEDEITKELVDAIAGAEPLQFICLDRGFKGNDQLKANAVQTFAARNQGRDKQDQIVFRTV